MSVASAATVITSPISTFASTRVRDGNFDPEAVGSRTLAVTRPEEPSLGPAAALAPPDLARPGGPSPAPPRPRALSAEPAGLGLPVVRLVRVPLAVPLASRLAADPLCACLASRHAGRSRM